MKISAYLFILVPVICISCNNNNTVNETAEPQSQAREIIATEVISMQPAKSLSLPGELHSWNRVNIHSKVKGFVSKLLVDRGTYVKKGETLAVLEAPEIIEELDKARGELAAAEASLAESISTFTLSKTTYERLLEASKTPGAISRHELDEAKTKMAVDSALSLSAKGNFIAAQSHYNTKKELVNYLTITAPFNGIITERNISPGSLIGAGEAGSKPMFVLEDNEHLRLTLAIPEAYVNSVDTTSSITFTVNAIPHKTFKSKLGRSAFSIDEKNRVMMTEFDIINKNGELKPGMYADAIIQTSRSSSTLFVPKTSVVSSSQDVFIIRVNNNKSEWVTVKKGITLDSLVEVFGTVKEGDKIVLAASEEIRKGQDVKIKEVRKMKTKNI